jgi:hypothetical protein
MFFRQESNRKKISGGGRFGLVGAVAVCAILVLTTAAAAGLTPGSHRHPRGIKLTTNFGWTGGSVAKRPTLVRLDISFPRGSVYNGAHYPRCSKSTLDSRGLSGCPRGSIMGHGGGTADASTIVTHPKITVVNGGGRVVYFYTVVNSPVRIQEAIVGRITRVGAPFAYQLSSTIPQNLRVVAGVAVKLTSLNITAGRGTWLALTSAPAGIQVATTYTNGETISNTVLIQNS